jgi:catechol 2,3-dioxygenase-like lactoylglutathione lyase family enzyme
MVDAATVVVVTDIAKSSERYRDVLGLHTLKRDEIGMNHHRALGCCLSMIFSENRFTLFRIML